ncbi:MAG: transglycosylase domain-containing protein [Myxococcota bacterium]
MRWTDLPRPLILAFLASEDERFFDHSGLDFRGILRAMVTNLFSGEAKEGASTITQQLVKNLVGADKTYRRKVKEAILARRLEDLYSKEQILTWYLNVIFLGHNSYGVQAAAQSYFRKNVWELSLAECAILAGVPQSPSRTNPFVDLKAAKERMRTHVLDNMVRLGWITRAESDAALKEDIKVYPLRDVWGEEVPGYAAPIRRGAPARWSAPGEDWLERGLVIQMAVEPVAQRQAEAAVAGALEALARKQGFPGPLAHFDDARRVDFLVRNAPHVDLALGHRMLARVTAVTPTAATLEAGLATRGTLPLANASWAAPYTADPKAASNSFGGELKDLGAALAVGDVVLVEVVAPPEPPKPKPAKKPKKPKPGDKDAAKDASDDAEPAGPVVAPGPPPGPYFALVPVPLVEGALASTDLWSGGLEAMVGSYDYDRSEVNRTESVRQTASAIKPIVYGKAYDMGLPASQLFSTAEYIDLATNYRASRESDKAEITVWEGLAESDNPVSHRVLDWVLGHTSVADYADWGKRLGLPFPLTGLKTDVRGPDQTLMGLLRAFTTYARQGRPPDLTMVKKVVDREGRILERRFAPVDPHATASDALVALWDAALHPVAPVVSPTTSFIVARNLAEGVQSGTGSYARRLGREAAGKTGTLSHDVVRRLHRPARGGGVGRDRSPGRPHARAEPGQQQGLRRQHGGAAVGGLHEGRGPRAEGREAAGRGRRRAARRDHRRDRSGQRTALAARSERRGDPPSPGDRADADGRRAGGDRLPVGAAGVLVDRYLVAPFG